MLVDTPRFSCIWLTVCGETILWIHLPRVTGPGAGGGMPRRREDVERPSVAEPLLAAAGAPEPSAGRTPVERLESQCRNLFLCTN